MSANGIGTVVPVRRRVNLASLALRLLVAFMISWLIVLAFFVTSVISH